MSFRKSRILKRRFSSNSINTSWNNAFAALSSSGINTPRGRRLRKQNDDVQSDPDTPYEYIHPGEDEGLGIDDSTSNLHLNSHNHQFYPHADQVPLTYASLPPTPISRSPSPLPLPLSPSPSEYVSLQRRQQQQQYQAPFSLWDYLREELLATDFDSHQELKWERVSNFLSIPLAMEKIIGFGFILCFDSFLYTFTVLPIRTTIAVFCLVKNLFSSTASSLPPSQKADILRTLLLILTVAILVPLTDASKIYHFVRGQDTIKLYVIFNALEIGDRLCASIGQDILDCLFSRSTLEPLSHRVPFSSHTFRPLVFFLLATVYNVLHCIVMVYQLISLNVAVNSYDNALLSLLISNQFVEIKGSVFKKFEKDGLFQITCADIVERFTLTLMLGIVAFRNLIELSGSEFDFDTGGFVLPKSFGWFWFRGHKTINFLWTISYPVLTVMISEMLVDWLKHAFITKFNHIRPSVYERFTDVLCRDLASGSAVGRRGARKHTYVDQSPLVARRLGFSSLPLAVLAILIFYQSLSLLFSLPSATSGSFSPAGIWNTESSVTRGFFDFTNEELLRCATWIFLGVLIWLCFVVIKIIIGVNLISYATRRRAGMEARAAEDVVNDFGRDPVGEGKEERQYNRELKTLLDNQRDDMSPTAEIGENPPRNNNDGRGRGKKGRIPLEELTRYTMVKRIW
ncbi:eukaryotic membrane protein family-domain-containing protein [Lentinula aff. lateritia]|uniref:Eukaryotic membrane protein family-domain-containing protein n=1 Tax=Lentinula aff. lateritia TaxID=2804960 RepID=A0ACC1UFH4_9AGAR|nr:eukaryotic membrane protein family-domain-containing protein [Lentinula aff. lateritia]